MGAEPAIHKFRVSPCSDDRRPARWGEGRPVIPIAEARELIIHGFSLRELAAIEGHRPPPAA